MYKYITINVDGQLTCETHKKLPDWRVIQKYVKGPFQIVPYFSSLEYEGEKLNRGTAYANEEGYVHGMPHNEAATKAWMKACPKGKPERMQLSGPILFVVKDKPKVFNGEES